MNPVFVRCIDFRIAFILVAFISRCTGVSVPGSLVSSAQSSGEHCNKLNKFEELVDEDLFELRAIGSRSHHLVMEKRCANHCIVLLVVAEGP